MNGPDERDREREAERKEAEGGDEGPKWPGGGVKGEDEPNPHHAPRPPESPSTKDGSLSDREAPASSRS